LDELAIKSGVARLISGHLHWSLYTISTIDKHIGLRHYGCVSCGLPSHREWKLGSRRENMSEFIRRIWSEDQGQDIAEYAVMLAVILVLVVGTIRLIGSNANNVFSNTASSIQ
jgi:Flp pilus assembly pilin Flp